MAGMTFGEWLRQERKRRRMTSEALAAEIGVARPHISRIENGHVALPAEETRIRIHMALGTSEDDLVQAGILERIESPFGGEPVYVAAESITPGERAAERAHTINDHGNISYATDPRRELLALLAGASDNDVRKVIQIVRILVAATDAVSTDLLHDIEPGA